MASTAPKLAMEKNKFSSDLEFHYINEKDQTLPNNNNHSETAADKDHTTRLLDNERGSQNVSLAAAEDDSLEGDPGRALLTGGSSDTLPSSTIDKPDNNGNSEVKMDFNKDSRDVDDDLLASIFEPVKNKDDDEIDGAANLESRFGDDDYLKNAPDQVDWYQRKKIIAQGMMDLALFSANANQLRYVLDSNHTEHPYYYFSLVLISLSIILQVVVGVAMVLHSQCDVSDAAQEARAHRANDTTVLGVFLITVLNVFISSFSVSTTAVSPPPHT